MSKNRTLRITSFLLACLVPGIFVMLSIGCQENDASRFDRDLQVSTDCLDAGDYRRADDLLGRLLADGIADSPHQKSLVLNRRGIVAAQKRELKVAAKYYSEALSAIAGMDAKSTELRSLIQLNQSRLASRAGDTQNAIIHAEESLSEMRRTRTDNDALVQKRIRLIERLKNAESTRSKSR